MFKIKKKEKNKTIKLLTVVRKKGIIFLLFLLFSFTAFSQGDLVGGNVTFQRIGRSLYCFPLCGDSIAYRIKVKLYYQYPYRYCDTVNVNLYDLDDSSYVVYRQPIDFWNWINETHVPCEVAGTPMLSWIVIGHYLTVNLKPNIRGWRATWQSGCQ